MVFEHEIRRWASYLDDPKGGTKIYNDLGIDRREDWVRRAIIGWSAASVMAMALVSAILGYTNISDKLLVLAFILMFIMATSAPIIRYIQWKALKGVN
jgi:hypothetical protein